MMGNIGFYLESYKIFTEVVFEFLVVRVPFLKKYKNEPEGNIKWNGTSYTLNTTHFLRFDVWSI
jgi:hypothetical protein